MNFLKKVSPFVLLVMGAAFTACETIVEVPMPEHTPKLAVRYMLGNEAPTDTFYNNFYNYQPFVSHSQSVLATSEIKGLNDASLVVTNSAGQVVETFQSNSAGMGPGIAGDGYYFPVSNFKAEPGQAYTLSVSAPGYETVTSTLKLPAKLNGLQGSYIRGEQQPYGEFGRVTFTLPDPASENNYYLLYGMLLDDRRVVNNRDVFYEKKQDENGNTIETDLNEVHFSNSSYDVVPFSDETLNGKNTTISREVIFYIGDPVKRPKYLRLIVHSITRDTYRFLKSSQSYIENNGNPFAEPTRVIGNIQNGYGYFGGFTSTYVDIPL